jgi:hypothetical protein
MMHTNEIQSNQNLRASCYEAIAMRLMIIAPCFFIRFSLDNDAYWLIQAGRVVLHQGIPTTDPLTFHSGLNYVMQQWLSAVCFASIYDTFGIVGMIMVVLIVFITMTLLIQRLCFLISNNEFVSYVVTIMSVIVLWPFMTTRPFLISLLIFLIEILVLEKVVQSRKYHFLTALPLLSVLLVNFQAALWPFFFVVFIPYLFDSFKFHFWFIKGEGYPRIKILAVFVASLLAGFLNPYGLKSMTYLFRSYGHSSISTNVMEMQSPNFQTASGFFVFAILFAVVLILIISKNSMLKLRYALLMLGTGFMALSSLRNLSLFAVCGMPMLAFVIRDLHPGTVAAKKISLKIQIALSAAYIVIVLVCFAISLSDSVKHQNEGLPNDAIAFIQKVYKSDDIRLFTDYNWGGYSEFKGLKPFIDARAEVFLKVNNGKGDILDDLLAVDSGRLYYTDFINKYRLNVFLLEKNVLLDVYLSKDSKYHKVYESKEFVIYDNQQ